MEKLRTQKNEMMVILNLMMDVLLRETLKLVGAEILLKFLQIEQRIVGMEAKMMAKSVMMETKKTQMDVLLIVE